jgi:DNA-directed RNA polymerase beta subunit/DNA-directed RNA polymerase beta' subunit
MLDYKNTFSSIIKNTTNAITSHFPIVGKERTLVVENVTVDDPQYDLDKEMDAKWHGKSITTPVYGHVKLMDNVSGAVLDENKRAKLMKLPIYTPRGTFVIGGNEYSVAMQNRRKPGIYPIRRDTGEIEAEFNIAGGSKEPLGMKMDPKTGKFTFRIGQSKKDLYPILRASGISDEEIEKRLGRDILDANRAIERTRGGNKFTEYMDDKNSRFISTVRDSAKRLTGKTYANASDAAQAIRENFAQLKMDKEVNSRTLGLDHDTLHPETLLRTAEKMLRINKGQEQPVDRNALYYKSIHGVEDYIPERIKIHMRKQRHAIQKRIDRRVKKGEDSPMIRNVITPGLFTKPVESMFKNESFSEIGDQYNPLDMISAANKITALGKGGITKTNTIRDDMRALHNTQIGYLDPIQTPESEKIGMNLHLSSGAVKRGDKLYTRMYNVRNKRTQEVAHTDTPGKVIALPGSSWDAKTGRFKSSTVRAFKDGKMQEVPVSEVDFVHEMPQSTLSIATNLIPLINSNSGARMFMATKQIGQAISLNNREKPLVQSGKGSVSFDSIVGRHSGTAAPISGTVKAVDDKYIHIEGKGGKTTRVPIYKNFPLNGKHFLNTDKILVKPGQRVRRGQSIMDNNFTKDGSLALGTNLRVAYLSDGGYNFEDGITISKSAAEKLSSDHMYPFQALKSSNTEFGTKSYKARMPHLLTKDQMAKMDEGGIIKEGMTVKQGDPLVLATRKADTDSANLTLGRLSKNLARPYRDASVRWDNPNDGVVTKVVHTKDGPKVYVKSREKAVIADKLAGRYGNKGVITRILDDDKMPKDKDGAPMDILLNPATVPSRMNPAQIMETAIGKVAHKRGRPIVVESFKDHDNAQAVRNLLKQNGFREDGSEELFDPETGKPIGNIMTGYQYTLKLSKQAKTGFSARGAGVGEQYDAHQAPRAGSTGKAKAMDMLSLYALLAHGATSNLREMATDKASENNEFWRMLKNGQSLPAPTPTFAYQKFMSYLKGAGVNIKRKGTTLDMAPMTDDAVMQMSGGEITKPRFLRAKDLKPTSGGFMDPIITGGLTGGKWAHVSLAEPVLNPVFEKGALAVLGMKAADIDSIIKKRGSKGIVELLESVDLDKRRAEAEEALKIETNPKNYNKLNRTLHYIKGLQKFEMEPTKAYMLSKYPVLPPNMRPINQLNDRPGQGQAVAGANWLYRDMMLVNNSLKKLNEIPYIPDSVKSNVRMGLQNSVRAIAGLTDPVGQHKSVQPKGFVEQIKGEKVKEGFFQRKILRRTQDVTGRSVITPDPKLGIDEIGLPEEMAWKIYDPFVERRLRKWGMSYQDILAHKDKRSDIARKALQQEMDHRPVMLNRPPSLHKFSFLGFNPKLSNGKTIKLPSLAVTGFNADFDGDALMVHVPVREEAIGEVRRKMMASRNLFNPRADDPILIPGKEANTGIWRASHTGEGMKRLKEIVPPEFHSLLSPGMTKGKTKALLKEIGIRRPETYKDVAQKIKLIGDEVSYNTGLTINMNDLTLKDPKITALRKEMVDAARAVGDNPARVNRVLADYQKRITDQMNSHVMNNNLVQLSVSGGGGSPGQIRQMLSAPAQYTDANKNPIPIPISSNYGEGMGINDYFTSLHAARRGMIDRKMETADPGAFAKSILINTSKQMITTDKMPDDDGEEFDVTDPDAMNRYLAAPVVGKDGKLLAKKGQVLTPRAASRLRAAGAKNVRVHTVLSGTTPNGVNAKSFGLFVEGRPPEVGDNIGALAGQAMAEPLQQGAMKTFHTGGSVGEDNTTDAKGYDIIKFLVESPQKIPGTATLAKEDGKVDRIEDAIGGGKNVIINGTPNYVHQGRSISVKEGDVVKPGDALSSGLIHPRELLDSTKDMMKVRRYLVDALKENYAATGTKVSRRALEVVVKSLTDTAVVEKPGSSDFIKGDVVSYDYARHYNAQPPKTEEVTPGIIGKRLAQTVGEYKAGTKITTDLLDRLEDLDIESVRVKNDPIDITPVLLGSKQIPKRTGDPFTHMGFGYIKDAITQRIPQGQSVPLHGTNPLPAYAYGAEFGKGKPGEY